MSGQSIISNEHILKKPSIDELLNLISMIVGNSRLQTILFRGQGKKYYLDSCNKNESIMPSVYRGIVSSIQNHPATIFQEVRKFLCTKIEDLKKNVNGKTLQNEINIMPLDKIYQHLSIQNLISSDAFPTAKDLKKILPHLFFNENICLSANALSDYESFCLFDYLNRYPKGCSINNIESIEAILIEMAQKGKHTRLLDVSTNPLVAILNASDDDNSDGVIYIFTEQKDYLYEYSFITKLKANSSIHARVVSYIKEFYLLMVNASSPHDIDHALGHILIKIQSGLRLSYEMPETNVIIEGFKRFFEIYKIKLENGKYPFKEINDLLDVTNEHDIKKQEKMLFPTGRNCGMTLLYKFLEYLGLPILVSPNFHMHEQLTANRILLQNSKFLLFSNKILNNKLGEISNYNGDEYANKLQKIIIPKNIKADLRVKLDRIYDSNMFYVDALDNIYCNK